MTGFITFAAVSLILVYTVRLLRTKASAKQTVFLEIREDQIYRKPTVRHIPSGDAKQTRRLLMTHPLGIVSEERLQPNVGNETSGQPPIQEA